MRLTIRFKLTALLILTGVLPLLAALLAVTLEGGRLRRKSVGESFLSLATSRAATMAGVLRHELGEVAALAREPDWIAVAASAESLKLSADEVADLDAQWAQLSEDAPAIRRVLDHPLAEAMRRFGRTRRSCREIFLTDRLGRVFAASNRTTDYEQSDESWWQQAYADGRGVAYISPVEYDRSAASWSVDVCVPLLDSDRSIVGVCKVVVDLERWVAQAVPVTAADNARPLVLQADGTIMFGRDLEPYAEQLAGWTPPPPSSRHGRWLLARDMLRAYAPIDLGQSVGDLEVESPRWFVVVQTPTRQALAEVSRLRLLVLVIGLVLIAGAFVIGMLIAHRTITRPLARLRKATARVAAGDLSHRVMDRGLASATQDELGQLASDFDRMTTAVERSHAALAAANETKSRFLRVAGHELRTPLTYILAMTSLLAGQTDDSKVLHSLETLRAKAQRLDEVIGNMLKLADTQQRTAMLELSQFNVLDLTAAVSEELQPFATRRGQEILTGPVDNPPQLLADRHKLHDALANLVGNAIKFTPDGGTIALTVEVLAGGHVAIRVRDQGQGIDEAQFAHLFEPFWGGGDVLKHSSGQFGYRKRGPGFGLAIARQFLRLHGGDIQVVSSTEGCEFSIIVPLRPLDYDASATPLGEPADQ